MGEIIKTIVATPIATILVLSGLGLIALSFLGRVKDYKIGKGQQNTARIVGAIILIVGLTIYFYDKPKDQISSAFGKARPGKSDFEAPMEEHYDLKTSPLSSDIAAAQLGVTIWRLRPLKDSDVGPKLLVQGELSPVDQSAVTSSAMTLVPERVETDTLFRFGEKVFLTVESTRAGYLYVIDREQYADGTTSASYLIYPILRSDGISNKVMSGRLISIPSQTDNPNYFSMSPLRGNQVGEKLWVIVSKEPVRGLPVTGKPLQLSNDQLARFETAVSAQAERYEMKNGAGRTWTQEEKEASEDQPRLLTQGSPLPQTIYRVETKTDEAVTITVTLRYFNVSSSK